MSKRLFYIEDGRPNIVIVPTVSLSKPKPSTSTLNSENGPPLKKPRLDEIPLPLHPLEPFPPGAFELPMPENYGPALSGISDLPPTQHLQIQNKPEPPSMQGLITVQQYPYSKYPTLSRSLDVTRPTSLNYNMESAAQYNAQTSQLNVPVEKSSVHCIAPTQYDVASTKCLSSSSSCTVITNILPDKTIETKVGPQVKVTPQKSSWASNHMMSIGQAYKKEIKINLSSSKKKSPVSQSTSEKYDGNSSKAINIAEKIYKNCLTLLDTNKIKKGASLSVDRTQKETEGSVGPENNSVVRTLQTQKNATPDNSSTIATESTQVPDINKRSETASFHKPKSHCDDPPRNQSNCREDKRNERHSREKNISHKQEKHVSSYDSHKHRHSNDRYIPGYSRTSQPRVSEGNSKKPYRNVDTFKSIKRRRTSRTNSETKVEPKKSCVNKSFRSNTREQTNIGTRSDVCETSSSVKSKPKQSTPLKSLVMTKDNVKTPEKIETARHPFDLRSKLNRKNLRGRLGDVSISEETHETLNNLNCNISEQVQKTLHERFANMYQNPFPNMNSNQVESLQILVSTDHEGKPIKPNSNEKAQTHKAETAASEKSQQKYQNGKKGKKRKNIKLVIQVICDESDSSDSVETVETTDFGRLPNEDLSFLDDLNIDEIVDTLRRSNAEPNTSVKNNNIVYSLVSDDEISNASTVQLEELNDILEDITATDDEKKPFELKSEATTSNDCKESSLYFPQKHKADDEYMKTELKEPLLQLNASSTEDVVIKQEKNIIDEDKHEILKQVNTVKKTEIKQENPDIPLQTNASLMSNITMTDIYRNLDKSHYNIGKLTGHMDVCGDEPVILNSEIKQEPFADIPHHPDSSREVLSDANVAMIADFPSSTDSVDSSLKENAAMNVVENVTKILKTEVIEESALGSVLPTIIVEKEPMHPELELNSQMRECSQSPNINKNPLEKSNACESKLPGAKDDSIARQIVMEIKQEPHADISLPCDMLKEVLNETISVTMMTELPRSIHSSKGNTELNVKVYETPGSKSEIIEKAISGSTPEIICEEKTKQPESEFNSQILPEGLKSPNIKENPLKKANEHNAFKSKLPSAMDKDLIASKIVMENMESDTQKETHDLVKEILSKVSLACEKDKITENSITTDKSKALDEKEVKESESGNIEFTKEDTAMEKQAMKLDLIEKSKDENANNKVQIPGNEPTAMVTENNETFMTSRKAIENENKENSTEAVKVTENNETFMTSRKAIKNENKENSTEAVKVTENNETFMTSRKAIENENKENSTEAVKVTENNETFMSSRKAIENENKENSTKAVKATVEEIKPKIKKSEPLKLISPSVDIVSHDEKTKISEGTKLKCNNDDQVPSSCSQSTIKSTQGNKSAITFIGDFQDSEKQLVPTLARNLTEKLKDSFKIVSVISRGQFSTIFHFKNATWKNCVIKHLRENKLNTIGLSKIKLLEDLQNHIPAENLHIIRYLNSFIVNHTYCLVLEYFPKNLRQVLNERKAFNIDTVNFLSKQLVTAVNILRQKNVIHADIKPEHILLNDSMSKLKLCGFDSAYYIDEECYAPCTAGMPNYKAPEIILRYPADFGVDVWSTALVMFEMSVGRQLFPGRYCNDILYKQMCTLGYIPIDILLRSNNLKNHFAGNRFKRRYGRLPHEFVLLNEFELRYNNILKNALITAYHSSWGINVSKAKRNKDVSKVNQLILLLQQMLAIHPQNRMPVEFVYADPFFTCILD